MAVMKRNGHFYIYFRPFKNKKIGLKLDVKTKTEANRLEIQLLTGCRSGSYGALDPVAREVCVRMFTNQGWEMPYELSGAQHPREELTLWRACEYFLKYPDIKGNPSRDRYEMCIVRLVDHFGRDKPVKSIWVPDIKRYQIERLDSGASPSTVNWEKGTLSKIFQVLVELQYLEANPARLVKNLSQKSEERHVYLSLHDVDRIAGACPPWFRPIVQTAYYTGMRRGEILGLTRKQVKLQKRMILLGPENTKEAHWKRVPIHNNLIPTLEEATRVSSLGNEKVFLLRDDKGVRDLTEETAKNPWPRACASLALEKPWPRFHDLRHTWRANARRSGIDPTIAESILGHWFRGRSVNERYGHVSDQELLAAVDKMTFDNGETEIMARR